MPSSWAIAAIGRPDDRTSATASALNSGENCRRCCPIGTPSARHSLAGRVSTTRGEAQPDDDGTASLRVRQVKDRSHHLPGRTEPSVTPALLVLWDVDHTLIDSGGVGGEIYAAAFENITGQALEQMAEMPGRTEPVIFRDTLALHRIEDPGDMFDR